MFATSKNISVPKNEKATVFVFGDIQEHSSGFNKECFQAFKDDFVSTKNAYAIGLGDYGDFIRPSLRKRLNSILDPEQDRDYRRQLDDMVNLDLRRLCDKFSFLNGKVLGLTSGHHEWVFSSGETSTQRLARLLGADYLGWTAYLVLKVKFLRVPSKGKKGDVVQHKDSSFAVKFYCTHGSGGGLYNHSDLSNLERKIAPYWIADVYLRGHSSKGELAPIELNDVSVLGKCAVNKKTRWLVNCPGMMNGYIEGETSYVELNNMPPASLGYAKVEIRNSDRTIENALSGERTTGVRIQPYIVSPYNNYGA